MGRFFSHSGAFLLLLLTINSGINAQCLTSGRYYEKIFSTKSTKGIQYGNAMKFDSTYVNLLFDIYEPAEDSLTPTRPLLIFAFPGSFTSGFRNSPDIVRLCNEFSQRGYVCASIDYRLGFENGNDSDTNQFKALIRGVQDMKAAVRYFYKDAETANNYRIDTKKIFIGGVSAGAFIALNYAYGKTDTLSFPAPEFALQALADLGGTEGNSGNPGYPTKVRGVIDLCGGIADTVWIMPNDPPLCVVHGTADDLVACQFDSAAAAQTVESRLFGGCDIKRRLSSFPNSSSVYLFEGAGHVPFILPCFLSPPCSDYMDTTIWVVRDFLYNQICFLSTDVNEVQGNFAVNVYPNPSDGAVVISHESSGTVRLQLFSHEGKLAYTGSIKPGQSLRLHKDDFAAGVYFYSLSEPESGKYSKGKIVFY